ncbi:MAG: DNA repair exonuclease [Pirellulales bacterium]
MFKFVHAADIHLDSPLRGLERYDEAPVDEIRGATRRALANLVQLAIDEQAAFVLLAGDLYDGDWHDHQTGLFFVGQMARLREAGIKAYLIAGNHDAANRMTKSLRLPDNVHQLSTGQPETVPLDECGTMIHGQGFANAACSDDLSQRYPAATPGCFNVGVLHTSATGRPGHEPYAPCTVDGLRTRQYDYWALGHVHQREVLSQDPPIHFPGNIQGRHIRETGAKGCLLASVDDQRRATAEFRPLDVLRWEQLAVEAGSADDEDDVLNRFQAALEQLLRHSDGRPLAMRVEIRGACRAHQRLVSQPERWINEVRAAALHLACGRVWIEKVLLRTAPVRRLDGGRASDGPLGELLQYIDEVRADPAALAGLGQELADLARKLPAEMKEGPDRVPLGDPAWLGDAMVHVEAMLVDRLLALTEET